MAVITISRDPGASGEEIAARLAGKLGFLLIDRPHLLRLWREMDLDETSLANVDERIPPGSSEIQSETEATMPPCWTASRKASPVNTEGVA